MLIKNLETLQMLSSSWPPLQQVIDAPLKSNKGKNREYKGPQQD
jgi:hypothetical protein